jgi:hypothetical protein
MTDEKKPDPIEDIRAGLGLLFRAAKTAVDEFPTEKLEDAVKQGVREVGRAIENVTTAIEGQVTGKKAPTTPPSAPPPADPAADPKKDPPAAKTDSSDSDPQP